MDALKFNGRRPRGGFTLIELLTVMAIMGLLLGLSVAAFRDMGRGTGMRGAVIQFKSQLTLARQQAVTKRQPHTVVYGNTNEALGVRGYYFMTANNVTIGSTNFLPNGVRFGPTNQPPPYVLEFLTDGSCSSAGAWNNQRRDILLEQTTRQMITNQFRVYQRSGRVKVLADMLDS